ncbi:MAG: GDP-mannose 4,6-dehydratase [Nanoarchaeota archaeon]|nr:GDP-mannose 4,6-dehydratase [Nanoarchaeota archaeon]
MKVLITGIDGFVAPFLAKIELEAGNSVYGSYLKEPSRLPGVHYVFMDLLDKQLVEKIIAEIKPDRIYHLAGFSSVAESWKYPEMAMKVNAHGMQNLLDGIVDAKIKPKIVVVSSADVYGVPEYLPINESHLLNPQSPYGKSRVEQEKIISRYKDLDITIARSFSHTGPGQEAKFVCSAFSWQIALIEQGEAKPVIMHGNLEIKRDFSDVRDIVRAYKLLAEKGKSHDFYNVCSGRLFSLNEILDMLLSMSTAKIVKKLDPSKVRQADILVLHGDNSKLKAAAGWKPEIDFKQTLKEILEYWRKKVAAV